MNRITTKEASEGNQPWYRVGMVWMVIALPLTVVVASMITISIAIDSAPVIIEKNPPVKNESLSEPASR